MSKMEIHYNAFETIEEQLKEQGYSCKDVEIYEKTKDSIMYLWVYGYLTEAEWNKVLNKLHKKILKNIKKVEG